MEKLRNPVLCRIFIFTLAFAILNLCQSCMVYHQAKQSPGNVKRLSAYIGAGRYFILYCPEGTFHLENLSLRDDTIVGRMKPVSDDHLGYLIPPGGKSPVLYQPQTSIIEDEVLLFTKLNMPPVNSNVKIPISAIDKMYIYRWSLTTGSIVGILLATAGVAFIILIASALSNMNLNVSI